MKPVSLSIAGLHSFREKQVIDFEILCSGGVFGIFGPTGSGKSSILDAMTLALYGKVERAANNTHGILNHAEKELHVAFTFELENATDKKRYTIERGFKRSDEMRVKSVTSRLIEEASERFVLADKTNDVNQHVQDLLGLTIDDFTRAVVLPQGKFAEFLSLKGAERRQMLQRLFNLEQYGDKLNKKLRDKMQKLTTELENIIAYQSGLGEASSERLQEAEELLKSCEVLLDKREKELLEVEKDYERFRQLWEWQLEKGKVKKELTLLEEQQGGIKEKEEKLEKAKQSEMLRPYMEAYHKAKERCNQAQIKLESLKGQLLEVRQHYDIAYATYKEKRELKTKEEPILAARKEKLGHAKQLQHSVRQLTDEIQVLIKDEKRIQSDIKGKKEELSKAESLYARGTEKQKQLKEELKQADIIAGYRDKVQQALYGKQHIIQMHQMLQEATESFLQKQKQLASLEEQAKETEVTSNLLMKRGQELFHRLQTTYHIVCEREKELEQETAKSEELVQQLKKKADDEKTKYLALQLAERLIDGEACPVCGSLHHPSPASLEEGDNLKTLLKRLEEMENWVAVLRSEKYEFASLKIQFEQLAQYATSELTMEWNPVNSLFSVEPLQGLSSELLESKALAIQTEVKALKQDYLETKDGFQTFVQKIRALQTQKEQLSLQLEHHQKDAAERREKKSLLQMKLESAEKDWESRFAPFDFANVEDLQREIAAKDQLQQQLKERIDKSVNFLEQTRKQIEQLTAENNISERKYIECKANLSNKQLLLTEKEQQLKSITGEEDADVLWEDTIRAIEILSAEEEKAYEKWQKQQLAYQHLDSDTKAAEQSVREFMAQFEEAEQNWLLKLSETIFAGEEQVMHSFMNRKEMDELTEMIYSFWDKIRELQNIISQLDERLKGEIVTEEKWEELKQYRIELQGSVRHAIQEKGAAQRALEDIRERHDQFKKLEIKRIETENLVAQHQKLQNVFKGNSFVEFIAEEQLMSVSRDASQRLGILTRQRYAIEVDSQGGFIMRDDANGGVRRPVTTLSGGETFLTSLALALALSAQIQLRGEYPLQFFFLDEGFGTLDTELLDTVITSLEKLQSDQLSIGVISHVQELRARLLKRLIVDPAEPSGRGTRIIIETL